MLFSLSFFFVFCFSQYFVSFNKETKGKDCLSIESGCYFGEAILLAQKKLDKNPSFFFFKEEEMCETKFTIDGSFFESLSISPIQGKTTSIKFLLDEFKGFFDCEGLQCETQLTINSLKFIFLGNYHKNPFLTGFKRAVFFNSEIKAKYLSELNFQNVYETLFNHSTLIGGQQYESLSRFSFFSSKKIFFKNTRSSFFLFSMPVSSSLYLEIGNSNFETSSFDVNTEKADEGKTIVNLEGSVSQNSIFSFLSVSCCSGNSCEISVKCPTSVVNINECEFSNNFSPLNGGVFFVVCANFSILNSDFYTNSANFSGGAIASLNSMNFSVVGCTFHDSQCGFLEFFTNPAYGGSIYFFSSRKPVSFLINKSLFENSNSFGSGGSLFLEVEGDDPPNFRSKLKIEDSKFLKSSSSVHGGSIFAYILHSQLEIVSTLFQTSSSKEKGGILYFLSDNMNQKSEKVDLIISKSSFFYGMHVKSGGLVYSVSACVKVLNSSFESGHSVNGGGFYIENSFISFNKWSYFKENHASYVGGCIYSEKSIISFESDEIHENPKIPFFSNCYAQSGSGIYVDRSSIKSTGFGYVTFVNCQSTHSGTLFATFSNPKDFKNYFDGNFSFVFCHNRPEIMLNEISNYKYDDFFKEFDGIFNCFEVDAKGFFKINCSIASLPSKFFFEKLPTNFPYFSNNFRVHPNEIITIDGGLVDTLNTLQHYCFTHYCVKISTTNRAFSETVCTSEKSFSTSIFFLGKKDDIISVNFQSFSYSNFFSINIQFSTLFFSFSECDVGFGFNSNYNQKSLDNVCLKCQFGSFKLSEGNRTCTKCPSAEIVEFCDHDQIKLREGYYGTLSPSHSFDLEIFKCHNNEACKSGEIKYIFYPEKNLREPYFQNECFKHSNRDNSSFLCESCLPGFSKFEEKCLSCETNFNFFPFCLYIFGILFDLIVQHFTAQASKKEDGEGETPHKEDFEIFNSKEEEKKEKEKKTKESKILVISTKAFLILCNFAQTIEVVTSLRNLSLVEEFLENNSYLKWSIEIFKVFSEIFSFILEAIESLFSLQSNLFKVSSCPFFVSGYFVLIYSIIDKFVVIFFVVFLVFLSFFIYSIFKKCCKNRKLKNNNEGVENYSWMNETQTLLLSKNENAAINNNNDDQKSNMAIFFQSFWYSTKEFIENAFYWCLKSLSFKSFIKTLGQIIITTYLPLCIVFAKGFQFICADESCYWLPDTRISRPAWKLGDYWKYLFFVQLPLGIYVFLFPIFLLIFMVIINRKKMLFKENLFSLFFGMFYEGYREKCFWFEIVFFYFRLFLVFGFKVIESLSFSFDFISGTEYTFASILVFFMILILFIFHPYGTRIENNVTMFTLAIVLFYLTSQSEKDLSLASLIAEVFSFVLILIISVLLLGWAFFELEIFQNAYRIFLLFFKNLKSKLKTKDINIKKEIQFL